MNTRLSKAIVLIAVLNFSTGAFAHLGAEAGAHALSSHGFAQGLAHPLSGLDHLAAMLAVGLWSALTARRLWTAPLAFVSLLLVGAMLGLAGFTLPALEPLIAASLLVLGLLVSLRKGLSALSAAALVGVFAVFHGMAHGSEMMNTTVPLEFLAGMLMTTLGLHASGLGIGLFVRSRSVWWPRVAGGAVALLGGGLLLQMV
jgi:urease accessory protein